MPLSAATVLDGLDITKYDDWVILDERIRQLVKTCALRKIQPLRIVHVKSEEWYLESATGDIYVYVQPDDKILPVWEKIDVFFIEGGSDKNVLTAGLKIIRTGNIDRPTFMAIHLVLQELIKKGEVEIIRAPRVFDENSEAYYREVKTKMIYRLASTMTYPGYVWERI
jgi:hypothetical protein